LPFYYILQKNYKIPLKKLQNSRERTRRKKVGRPLQTEDKKEESGKKEESPVAAYDKDIKQ
jgi:hypothetical protein